MKTLCLLYAVADFAGMLWTGYHPLFLIVSFWLALFVFFALVSHAQQKQARHHRETLLRMIEEAQETRQ